MMTKPIQRCELPSALTSSLEGTVSARSTIDATRHGVKLWAEFDAEAGHFVYAEFQGVKKAFPLASVYAIEWAAVDEPKKAAKRGPTPDDAKP